MVKQNIIEQLKNTLERTGYVTNIEFFNGEFHEDSRLDKNPSISYIINFTDDKKDTKLHKLEEQIRLGFFNGNYADCKIKTSIEDISETEEKHTLYVEFNQNDNHQSKQKRTLKMAKHLLKIINEDHFKNQ